MAMHCTRWWQGLPFEESLSDLLFQPATPAEWDGLRFLLSPHTDTRSFCACRRALVQKSIGRRGFCSSLPVELHGSTISPLEEDRREDKVFGGCEASAAAEEDLKNICFESFLFR